MPLRPGDVIVFENPWLAVVRRDGVRAVVFDHDLAGIAVLMTGAFGNTIFVGLSGYAVKETSEKKLRHVSSSVNRLTRHCVSGHLR